MSGERMSETLIGTKNMSINAFLHNRYDPFGKAGRIEFLSLWLTGLLATVIYFAPLVYASWEFVQATIDYGADAASLLVLAEENETAAIALIYIWGYLWGLVMWALLIMQIMTTVRRIRHIGWSPWWILLGTVPLINIGFLLVLFLWPGKKGICEE